MNNKTIDESVVIVLKLPLITLTKFEENKLDLKNRNREIEIIITLIATTRSKKTSDRFLLNGK